MWKGLRKAAPSLSKESENRILFVIVVIIVIFIIIGHAEFCPDSSGASDATLLGGLGTAGIGNIPNKASSYTRCFVPFTVIDSGQ